MLKKLHIRFICITMTIATVMLGVILGMVIHFTGKSLEEQSIQMMRAVSALPGPPGKGPEGIRLPYFTITLTQDGVASVSGGYDDLVSEQELDQILQLVQEQTLQSSVLKEYGLRFWNAPGPGPERIVFADITSEQATMKNLIRTCSILGAVGFFLFLGGSILLAKWAIRPVEKAWNQQKQFVADASHELKTPLTVIMTNAEMLQAEGYSPVERQQFADSILTMSQQMRGLVLGLLELARVDNGAVKTGFAPVDFSALTADGVLPFEPLFFEKDLSLNTQVEEHIRIRGSETHLRQVLDILLDNALKYSAPGRPVQVQLKRQGMHCILSVAGSGAPLSKEEQKDIFKRFYRVDKVRGRSGGYGLGLSIASSIVQEHRGRMWAQSENGENTFFVQLPTIG